MSTKHAEATTIKADDHGFLVVKVASTSTIVSFRECWEMLKARPIWYSFWLVAGGIIAAELLLLSK